jgi:chemotaxis protein MotC
MTGWAKPALGLALVSLYASHALGQDGDRPENKQPFEIVRSIQAIQDQIVRGNASARARLPKVIEQMSERLLAADREAWRDPRNARAAVIYTLSGGQARVICKAIETGLSPAPELELMRGSLAYIEGHEAEARKIFSTIDAKTVTPAAAGHVAMIQSALIAKENPGEAIRLLDQARVLAPGTLVEETALRRELVLADEIADIDKFAFLSSDYIWRFPNSAYFDSFRQRFMSSAVHFGMGIKPAQFAAFEELVGQVDSTGQLALYLQIARKSIIDGKPGAALFAARKAVSLAADASAERARSTLYEAAALILTDQYEKGIREFDAVDASRLPKQDVELKGAVASLAKLIGSGQGNPRGPAALESNEPGVSPGGESSAAALASTLIDLAQQKVGQAGEVLERKVP